MYDNLWDTGTLTTSSENANFPASNTRHPWPSKVWRSTAASGIEWLKVNLGSEYEMVTDGAMEVWTTDTNLTNWTEYISGTSVVVKDLGFYHGGAASCQMAVDSSNSSVYIYQTITLTPEKKYRISLWYVNSVANKTFYIILQNSTGVVFLTSAGAWSKVSQGITLPNALGWTEFTIDFDAHPNYTSYNLYIQRLSATSSTFWVDDVSVKRVYDVNAVEVWGHNLSETAAVVAYANETDVWTSPSLTQALTVYDTDASVFFTTKKNYPWWFIAILDAGNPDGFLSAGRLFLGQYFQPTKHFSMGETTTRLDPSPIALSEGHQASAIIRDKYNEHSYLFENMTTAQRVLFDALFDYVGIAKPFFICETPDTPSGATYYINCIDWAWQHVHYDDWTLTFNAGDYK
jgi:hypothetical protein